MVKENLLILKNSGILFLRIFLTSLISLVSSRLVLQNLGVSNFGLFSVVGGVVFIMAFLNTVMTSTTYRFISFELGKGDWTGVNMVFNRSLIIHIAMAFLVFLISESLGVYYIKNHLVIPNGHVSDALFVFRFSMYATICSIVSIPFQGLLTAYEKFSVQAFIEIIRSLLILAVAISLSYISGNKIRPYALLIAIVTAIPPIMFYGYCRVYFPTLIKWNYQPYSNKYKEMVSYTGWLMFGSAGWVGQRQGVDVLINSFFGTVLNAAFGIANQLNNIVSMFARNLGQAAIPQITKSISSGNDERATTLVAYVSKYTFFLMLIPALPLLLETNYVLKLWLGEMPPYTVIFSQLMVLNSLIDGVTSGTSSLILGTGKVKVFMIIGGNISLLCLPIAYFFFKFGYPPYSILLVSIVMTTCNLIVGQLLLKNLIDFNVKFFLSTTILRAAMVGVCIAPLFFLRDIFQEGLLRLILFSGFALIWLAVVILIVGIDKRERDTLEKVMRKVIKSQ